LAWLCSGT